MDKYQKAIMALDNKLKNPELELSKVPKLQEQLVHIADKYQDDERIGAERYRIYELQALIFFYQHKDAEALEYIDMAIDTLGHRYPYADNIKVSILGYAPSQTENSYNQNTHRHKSRLISITITIAILIAGVAISFMTNSAVDNNADANIEKVLDICTQDPNSADCNNIKQQYNATVTCDDTTCNASIPVTHWYFLPIHAR